MKIAILLLISGILTGAVNASGDPQDAGGSKGPYTPVTVFDPARNPQQDLRTAQAEAGRSGKRILLDVGGEWCSWCHTFDAFFEQNTRLRELRNKNFIMLKINVSPENTNQKFLSHYPNIPGYPHLFVLEANGRLLKSQGTGPLELGSSYDLRRVEAFLNKWRVRQSKQALKSLDSFGLSDENPLITQTTQMKANRKKKRNSAESRQGSGVRTVCEIFIGREES